MKLHFSRGEEYFWSFFILAEALVILVGNTVALRIFLRRKSLINKSCYLLVNLTVADTLVGLSSTVTWFVSKGQHAGFREFKVLRILFLIPLISLCSLAVISLERAVAVFIPFRHRVASSRYFFAAIGLSWLLSVVTSVTSPQLRHKFKENVSFIVIVFLLVILATSYVSIYIKMKFFPTLQNRTRQCQFKLSKTLFLTTVVSVIAWVPLSVIQFYICFCGYRCKRNIPKTYFMCALVAQLSNSFLNLIVYSFRLPDFRKELKAIIFTCPKRHRVQPSSRAEAFCIEARGSQTDQVV